MTADKPSDLPLSAGTIRIDGRWAVLFAAALSRRLRSAGLSCRRHVPAWSEPPAVFIATGRVPAIAAKALASVLCHGRVDTAIATIGPFKGTFTEGARAGAVIDLAAPRPVTLTEGAHAPGQPVGSFAGLTPVTGRSASI